MLVREPREKHFGAFMSWLKANNVNTDAVCIDKFPEGGYGVKATADIPVSILVIGLHELHSILEKNMH